MGFSVPLEYVLVIIIALIFILPAIIYFVLWCLIPFMNVQLFANLFKNDVILRDDGEKAYLIKGEKKDKESSLYRIRKGFLGFGPVKYIAIDPTKWDKGNGTRFGSVTLRYQYPGKLWLKNLPRMMASDLHLEVAKIPVKIEDTQNNPDAIIKHNKYLHLIAKNNDEQALKILRCETKAEIEKYVKEYFVMPPDAQKDNAGSVGNDKFDRMIMDAVQEVEWVHEYCSTLPREVNQSAMMKAYPDQETCYDIMAKIKGECEMDAKASSQFNILTMFMIIGGIILIMGMVEVITIIILAG